MAEYIEREALLELYDMGKELEEYAEVLSVPITVIRQNINDMPAADVAPVRHGRWRPVLEGVWNLPTPICVGWSCSLCGRYEQYKEPYCNCGAKMDLEGGGGDGR